MSNTGPDLEPCPACLGNPPENEVTYLHFDDDWMCYPDTRYGCDTCKGKGEVPSECVECGHEVVLLRCTNEQCENSR